MMLSTSVQCPRRLGWAASGGPQNRERWIRLIRQPGEASHLSSRAGNRHQAAGICETVSALLDEPDENFVPSSVALHYLVRVTEMGSSASTGLPSFSPMHLRQKRYSVPSVSRRTSAIAATTSDELPGPVRKVRHSIQVFQREKVESPLNVMILYEVDSLDLNLHRHLSENLVRDITSDAVWATIPHAVNGRSAKVLLVDRHQRVLTKRELSKVYVELKNHVHLAVHYSQVAQGDPTWATRMSYVPRLQELQHPNIIRLFGHFMQNRMLHVLVEYCQHGSLAAILDYDEIYERKRGRRLPIFHGEQAIRETIRQLCAAIAFIHDSQLAHTNLTPENVFVADDGHVVVGDFKDAVFVGISNKPCAVPPPIRHGFAAPECYSSSDDDSSSGNGIVDLLKADAWSTGALIFTMVTRQGLFDGASHVDPHFRRLRELGFAAFYNVWRTEGRGRDEPSVKMPEDIVELLAELLEVVPSKRSLVVDAVQRHDWLRGIGHPICMDSSQWKLTT